MSDNIEPITTVEDDESACAQAVDVEPEVQPIDKTRETLHKFMDVQQLMGIVRHRRMAQGGPLADASRGRGRVLSLLKLQDGVSTKEMAHILGIRVSSLNETLAKLEADGLVERRPDDQDKRVQLAYLTDAGRAAQKPFGRFPNRLFANFSDEELTEFGAYCDRISTNLSAELGEDASETLENMRCARRMFFAGHPGPHPSHGGCHKHEHGEGYGEGHGHGEGHCHKHHGEGHGRGEGHCHKHHGEGHGRGEGHCHKHDGKHHHGYAHDSMHHAERERGCGRHH